MAAKPTTEGLRAELEAALEAVSGVSVTQKPGGYSIVKHGKTTLGYVNGKAKVRVDWPMSEGKRESSLVKTKGDVTKTVARMEKSIPTEPVKVVKAPKVKKESSNNHPIEGTVVLKEGGEVEVTPDPKPVKTTKRTRRTPVKA